MYPQISDLLSDLLGINICLPIQTFGFFMALGFFAGFLWLRYEFKRLEAAGNLTGKKINIAIGQNPTAAELLVNGLIGGLLGFKLVPIVANWCAFSKNPQDYLVTRDGSLIGAIIGAVLISGLIWWSKKKQALPKPQIVEETIYPHHRVGDIIIIAAIFGILGAKLFNWIEDWEGFLRNPVNHLLSFAGLNFYGGLICAAIALLVYAHKQGIPPRRLLDVAAPALFIAYGVGRLGCHFSGDGDWGIANPQPKPFDGMPNWAWAYHYPNNVVMAMNPSEIACYQNQQTLEIITKDVHAALPPAEAVQYAHALCEPVWPTSVYEFMLCSILFLILVALRKRLTPVPGILFAMYLIFNGVERFLIETIRVNERYSSFFNLTQAQTIAIALIILGIGLGIFFYQKKNEQPNLS
ncbi:MAG: prolipoprotein diacylglyceryl transferase [Sphingobacteriales bacterium]|jgi:phosphatidylglycerol:prolipoprotein diacylglycerol transferase|nr:prolipoprotein diacylglyceryl transferase [Sphingobacteriales bacterium]MBP9141119.1 prolipoprotein diacylglyceryl transferase [Chitinophagales bacterium]MDA0197723.1 prolipoprotein diacylglyceryl transferase [Bacteroidota bacterium]MBK6888821.1 prolipoprotein diacylglyceryl transferase [Sphingobacteriales bacterium]MBK7528672.1 prolipoprotein diacylglyceryl transferase [Sphingobacteriales bacterium]